MNMLYPIVCSLGIGGGVVGLFYTITDFIYKKIRDNLMCSITINYKDETFKWVWCFQFRGKFFSKPLWLRHKYF